MKLIVRADDYGYTDVHNLGTIKAMQQGIVTSVDVMLDTPGTIDALQRMKEFPWISIGWHAHFWGKPILAASEVPSMVDETGKFKFRKDAGLKATVVFEEALKESRAQIERCIQLLGKAPDTTWISDLAMPFEQARLQVCKEYGIAYNIARKPNAQGVVIDANKDYQHLDIFMPNQPATVYKTCYHALYEERMTYDPIKYYVNDEGDILNKTIALTAWHPGYLDEYVLQESRMRECRVKDVQALCSEEIKQWIIDNHIELVNHRDAIHGTQEYQNHLKQINSPLCMMK